jgi:adenosylcobyric acid synthase
MVCGTSSGAGKSFLVTALARWYARQGLRVAPFKAQNMSNNARVVADGEIGSAQYFQALAACCIPDVRMNPVLLKPEKDTRSQVICMGQRRDDLADMEWRVRAELLWPTVHGCLSELLDHYDLVVIEGAGSPAEINLQPDIVNMRVAEAAGAATLLVTDIDRGGAFAHLYGTYELLPAEHRALIRGFVLNKFRGDASLLAPGPQMLEELTGIATLGVLPMWRDHALPEEDGVFDAAPAGRFALPRGPLATPDAPSAAAAAAALVMVIVAYPHISNLDEFATLKRVPGVRVIWAHEARSVAAADVLVLPGSKHVAADLAWLRATGLDAAIAAHVGADKPTLGVCGGLQMLGLDIDDPAGLEGAATGMGLLPYGTEFKSPKRYRRGRYALTTLQGFWASLSGVTLDGYEIRHGHTRPGGGLRAAHTLTPVLGEDCGWQYGQTLALYVHGLFENAEVIRRLFGVTTPSLDDTFDGLADFVDAHIGNAALKSLVRPT